MSRRIILFIISVLILSTAAYLLIKNHNSYANLDVTFGENIQGVSVKIENESKTYDVTASSEVRLKKGVYQVQTSGPQDYEVLSFETEIKDGENNIDINPSFTKEKLSSMLAGQESAIQTVISSGINLGTGYRLNPGELFLHGEWYGTTIVPNITEEELRTNYYDVYRVVVKKSNDSWELGTNTPELVLTKVQYPDIPVPILSKANELYYQQD